MNRQILSVAAGILVSLAALAVVSHGSTSTGGDVLVCESDDGLVLPNGLCATVVADLPDGGLARGVAVRSDGTVYVSMIAWAGSRGGVWALRDLEGDGKPEIRERIVGRSASGLLLRNGWLYLGAGEEILRYRLEDDGLDVGDPEVLVRGLPNDGEHATKSLALDDRGNLFVNLGSATNGCQADNRTPGSPGVDPCPERRIRASVWRFDAERTGQTLEDGERWAVGIRNLVGFAVHPETGALYGVQHGRDDLGRDWPEIYSAEDEATKPAEEMLRIDRGDDFGWPYCIYDLELGRKVLAPAYGGDGSRQGRCADVEEPVLAFPGHWGPNALFFPRGSRFPERYRDGALIAFHGPQVRTPHAPDGLRVSFVPFEDGEPAGTHETLVDGFAGTPVGQAPRYRPMALAEGPDGSLYVLENEVNRLWRVFPAELAGSPAPEVGTPAD